MSQIINSLSRLPKFSLFDTGYHVILSQRKKNKLWFCSWDIIHVYVQSHHWPDFERRILHIHTRTLECVPSCGAKKPVPVDYAFVPEHRLNSSRSPGPGINFTWVNTSYSRTHRGRRELQVVLVSLEGWAGTLDTRPGQADPLWTHRRVQRFTFYPFYGKGSTIPGLYFRQDVSLLCVVSALQHPAIFFFFFFFYSREYGSSGWSWLSTVTRFTSPSDWLWSWLSTQTSF